MSESIEKIRERVATVPEGWVGGWFTPTSGSGTRFVRRWRKRALSRAAVSDEKLQELQKQEGQP